MKNRRSELVVRRRCARVGLVFAIAAFVLCGFVANDRASAATVVTNTSLSTNSQAYMLYTYEYFAMSFLTGAAVSTLDSIGLIVSNQSAIPYTFEAWLYSDSAGAPNAILETFADQPSVPNGSSGVEIEFNSVGTALAGATQYWIVLHQITGDDLGAPTWDQTFDTSEASAFGWTIGNQSLYRYDTDPWQANGDPAKLRVDATFAQEPPSVPSPSAIGGGAGLLIALAVRGRRRR